MRIGCIGWGSLIWNPGTLRFRTRWLTDGPSLPIEFARFSSGMRVTLVVVEGMQDICTLWALMETESLDEAIVELAIREQVSANIDRDIGRWKRGTASRGRILNSISTWAIDRDLDAVVWTALPYKLKTDADHVPTLPQVLARLREAQRRGLTKPREYVERSPRQVDTEYRRAINKEFGWTCVSDV